MLEICKVCGCKTLWKAGIFKGKQRYRCKNCHKTQVETDGRVKYSEEEREHAFALYGQGCGLQQIARMMSKLFGKNYRYQTIAHWIKRAGLKRLDKKTK